MNRLATLLALTAALLLSLASGSGTEAEPFDSGPSGARDGGEVGQDAASGPHDSGAGVDSGGSSGIDAGSSLGQDAGTSSADAGASGCSYATIFYDSPDVCGTGSVCSVDQSYNPTCLPEAAGGTYYGACGANNACPKGSLCSGPSAAEATCSPFCSTEHNTCPDNGVCAFSIPDVSGFMLCGPSEACDPVADTGCASGSCYVTSPDANMCLSTPGTGAESSTCVYANDCAPTLLCAGATGAATCKRMCNLGSDSDCNAGETCQNVGHPSYGVCG